MASDHPLRAMRALADEALAGLSGRITTLYATTGRPSIPPPPLAPTSGPMSPRATMPRCCCAGASRWAPLRRPSIPPEPLLRATLLQVFFPVRSERQPMEQINGNLPFRWFVGLDIDGTVWGASTFSGNRGRLLAADVAREFLQDEGLL